MSLKEVESSAFSSYQYDPKAEELIVHFTQGNPYRYRQVPAWEIEKMESADSKGNYFNLNIRNRYEFDELL